MFDTDTPRLWAYSGAEALLVSAHSHVQRIAAEFLHKLEGPLVDGIEGIVHNQYPKALGCSVKS